MKESQLKSFEQLDEERKLRKPTLIQKAICEGIGTSAFTFLACGVAVGGLSDTEVCISFGAVAIVMSYAIGQISGCHINPAVSLNVLIRGEMQVGEFFAYIVSQLIGAIIGSLLLGLTNHADFSNLCCNLIKERLTRKSDKWGHICGVFIEAFLTFFFIMLYNGATDKVYGNQHLAGLIFGVGLTVGVAAGYGFTGGSLNPFRSLGPALAELIDGQTEPIKEIWIFFAGPIIGSVCAAFIYKLFS